ncbi:MAG TPA: two-component regulator propeller domain-containing protein, partial [Chitinophagaceae bacterium]
ATPYSLFTVDTRDHSIARLSRITGLSETGVSAIDYDEQAHRLFVAYSNSNIDIIVDGQLHNVPDIKREVTAGDKTINRIYVSGDVYYLASGIGVILLDASKYEVKASWAIGSSGNTVAVTGITSDGQYLYAATGEGLKRLPVNGDGADYRNWQSFDPATGLPAGPVRDVVLAGTTVMALQSDSIFAFGGGTWSLLYADGNTITRINANGNRLAVCERLAGPVSRIVLLNGDGSVSRIIQQNGVTPYPQKAIEAGPDVWVADAFDGLSRFDATAGSESIVPDSPESTTSGEMTVENGTLYATAGEVNTSWNYQYNGNGLFRYRNGTWKAFNRFHYPLLDSMLDFITVAADPKDGSAWAGSFGGGLLHITTDEQFEIFKQNSPLQPPALDPTSYRVAGLLFDHAGNLWVSNYGSTSPLLVRQPGGRWTAFSLPVSPNEGAVSQLAEDNSHHLWVVSPAGLGSGLYCLNTNATVDDPSDDQWRYYTAGSGNLPSKNVLCIAHDASDFIWVGTDNGIGVIECTQNVFNGGCDAVWPVVAQGNFAGYLFAGQSVRDITVDGADRKWIATRDGAWLISADGQSVIRHFTEDNSLLLSSDVKKITVDGNTGEVFFATSKGICSYRGDATRGDDSNHRLVIFPNPVPPGYTGQIAIRGLVNNAIVKITGLSGRLVFQTRALGGQAVWDGKDYMGRSISSGVYLVLANTEDKSNPASGKIVFISK